MSSIILEDRVQKTPDIFNHYSLGLNSFNNIERVRKKIPFIKRSQLLTSHRKRRARKSTSD